MTDFFRPKFVVNTNPSIEMNANCAKLIIFPAEGFDLLFIFDYFFN